MIVVAVSMLVMSVSCRRTDVRTVLVSVPEMRNRACAEVIVKALSSSMGVKGGSDIKVDLVARTVSVQYESLLTARKNVEYTIAEAGFTANSIPANADAASKLSDECKGMETMIPVPAR